MLRPSLVLALAVVASFLVPAPSGAVETCVAVEPAFGCVAADARGARVLLAAGAADCAPPVCAEGVGLAAAGVGLDDAGHAHPGAGAAAWACASSEARVECVSVTRDGDGSGVAGCQSAVEALPSGEVTVLEPCARMVPSGSGSAIASMLEDCLRTGDCVTAPPLPQGAVVMLEYNGCGSCFTVTADPGWTCFTIIGSLDYLQVSCRPRTGNTGPDFQCANFHTTAAVLDGNVGTSVTSTTECGGHSVSCQATVGVNAGACTNNVFTPTVNPPLFCSIAVHHPAPFIRKAESVCFNDP